MGSLWIDTIADNQRSPYARPFCCEAEHYWALKLNR
jgi:hypothetical protein